MALCRPISVVMDRAGSTFHAGFPSNALPCPNSLFAFSDYFSQHRVDLSVVLNWGEMSDG